MKASEFISKPEVNLIISILIPLTALAIAWGAINTRMDHVEKLAIALQDQYGQQTKTNEDIKVKLAEIQKDIIYIRQELDRRSN